MGISHYNIVTSTTHYNMIINFPIEQPSWLVLYPHYIYVIPFILNLWCLSVPALYPIISKIISHHGWSSMWHYPYFKDISWLFGFYPMNMTWFLIIIRFISSAMRCLTWFLVSHGWFLSIHIPVFLFRMISPKYGWLVDWLVGWLVGRSVGWLVGYCPLIPHVTSPSSTSDAADVGQLGGRCCGHREGLAAGLHSAARGGAWQQRGGDWAAPGGEGQPGEDLVGMGGFWGS